MELVIDHVSKRYSRTRWGLRDFSLTLRPGVTGLLGPNGAGKSTLMRILATVSAPTSGAVRWNGVDTASKPNPLRSTLGYLPQDFGVYPNLSPVEFLGYLAAAKGLGTAEARARIDDLLALVNLSDVRHSRVGGFSGGMRQRVGIAQALLNDPNLLIIDEPTAGLDPEERIRFRELLTTLPGERIVLLSTHIVSDIEAAATSIALMADGQLLRCDAPDALLQALDGRVWELVVPEASAEVVRREWFVTGAIRRADGVHLRVVSDAAPPGATRPLPASLEDVYLGAIGAGRPAGDR